MSDRSRLDLAPRHGTRPLAGPLRTAARPAAEAKPATGRPAAARDALALSSAALAGRGAALTPLPSAEEAFLTRLYREVHGRKPDADGLAYWLKQLRGGMSRAEVEAAFKASPEAGASQTEKRKADQPASEFGAVPLISQMHPADDDNSYYNGGSNCGPTAMAMVARAAGFRPDLTDADLINYLGEIGGTTAENGTSHAGIEKMAEAMGLPLQYGAKGDMQFVKDALADGKLVVINGNFGGVTGIWGGHYVTCTGYDPATDTFTINDSGSDTTYQLSPDQLSAVQFANENGSDMGAFAIGHGGTAPAGSAPAPAPASSAPAAGPAAAASSASAAPSGEPMLSYTLRYSDTVESIAAELETDAATLCRLNGWTPDQAITAGTVFKLPDTPHMRDVMNELDAPIVPVGAGAESPPIVPAGSEPAASAPGADGEVVSVNSGPTKALVGALSEADIERILTERGTPLAGKGYAKFILEMERKYQVPAVQFIAQAAYETQIGKDGVTVAGYNIGNIRPGNGPGTWTGSTWDGAKTIDTSFGAFRSYNSWEEGIEDYFSLMAGSTYQSKPFVEQMAIYNPEGNPAEGSTASDYCRNVAAFMEQLCGTNPLDL